MRTTSQIKEALANSDSAIALAEEALDVINYLEDEYLQLKRSFDKVLTELHTYRSQNDINKHIINTPGGGG